MGLEIGDDGRLIKYSNLFNYDSLETLLSSLWLPTPKNYKIVSSLDKQGFDISKYVESILPYLNSLDSKDIATKIRILADIIIDMYDYQEKLGGTEVNVVYSPDVSDTALLIIRNLIIHEGTKLSPNLEEAAYRNSISANIKNIVLNLKNMDLAYSPISMDDLLVLASESEKGALVASMSLMNPLTKYLMLVQNMVGKKVIGIAAVGEKVFFNLNYYYNEGIRNGDKKWLNNLKFHHTFNRIQGRYLNKKSNIPLESSTKTSLANVNFENLDELRSLFLSASLIDETLRKKYSITDYDIENKTEKWEVYKAELLDLVKLLYSNSSQELLEIHKTIANTPPVDLMISLILSAATDFRKQR